MKIVAEIVSVFSLALAFAAMLWTVDSNYHASSMAWSAAYGVQAVASILRGRCCPPDGAVRSE